MLEIIRYEEKYKSQWNEFLKLSKNGTFLLSRNYMDYHKDKFTDHSLLVFRKNKLVCLFPANESESEIISHQGLTYGGFVLGKNIKLDTSIEVFEGILEYYKSNGFRKLIYKPIPGFYHKIQSQEDLYFLFLKEARLFKRETAFVIKRPGEVKFDNSRNGTLNKEKYKGITIEKAESFKEFWEQILAPNLMSRFGVAPVHSLEEIESLKKNNPDNIFQFNAILEGEIIAGITLFVTEDVIHCQYISANEKGKKIRALDYAIVYIIKNIFGDRSYFDFGTANKDGGKLNYSLAEWKESYGARAWMHDFYEINL